MWIKYLCGTLGMVIMNGCGLILVNIGQSLPTGLTAGSFPVYAWYTKTGR